VLIGHSMGGLVLKKVFYCTPTCTIIQTDISKAYILAKQQDNSQNLASRMRCTFFLATPHRGSDSASLLNNVLRSTGVLSARPYVEDLRRNSVSLQIINEEFRHYADSLSVWSFYETLKTNFGITSTLIVDKDSATLGKEPSQWSIRIRLINSKVTSTRECNY
jgi:hypothetical protein